MGRSVVLVCGPPGAGKSTWARASGAETVLDWDELAQIHGSDRGWGHLPEHRDAAEQHMRAALDTVGAAESGSYCVIRSAARGSYREQIAAQIRADRVVVLLPPAGVLRQRLARRPDAYRQMKVLSRWMRDWSPSPLDEVIS